MVTAITFRWSMDVSWTSMWVHIESGLMAEYTVFLCWSAIKSEPDTCWNKKVNAPFTYQETMDTHRIQGDEGNVGGGTNCCYGGSWCFCQYMTSPMNVRYIYGAFFILGIALAWGARENPQVFFRGQCFGNCEDDLDCLTVEAVLLFSLTFFLFFSFMSISTMFTRTVHNRRNSWHTQWWLPKMLLAAGCLMMAIVAPAGVYEFYGRLAHPGAGSLLFIQLIAVTRYITRLNSRWCQPNYLEVDYLNVNTVSILAYSASFIWVAIMFMYYTGCTVNAVLIGSTLLMVYLIILISSQLSTTWGWYMEAGLMGLYIVFLCWSAMKSEPDSSCNKKGKDGSSKSWEIISFVLGLFNIVVATFSTGNEYKSIQFKNVVGENDKPPYGYGFFHLVYALGSMHFGMLLLGWETYHASKKWSIDVSWTSMWIHIANEVLAAIFFVAILLGRIYGTDSHRQFLGHMFGIGGLGQQEQQQQHGDHQSNATETDTAAAQPPAFCYRQQQSSMVTSLLPQRRTLDGQLLH